MSVMFKLHDKNDVNRSFKIYIPYFIGEELPSGLSGVTDRSYLSTIFDDTSKISFFINPFTIEIGAPSWDWNYPLAWDTVMGVEIPQHDNSSNPLFNEYNFTNVSETMWVAPNGKGVVIHNDTGNCEIYDTDLQTVIGNYTSASFFGLDRGSYILSIRSLEDWKAGRYIVNNVGHQYTHPENGLDLFDFQEISAPDSGVNGFGVALWHLLNDVEPEEDDGDPNSEYPPESGYTGKPSPSSEGVVVGVPSLPTIDTSGGTNLYRVNTNALKVVQKDLWDETIFETILKVNESIMANIIDVYTLPITLSGTDSSINVGNKTISMASPYPTVCKAINESWAEIDFGTIKIKPKWACYLDYDPFTSIELYLPYYSSVALDIQQVMNKTLGVKYHFNVYNGECVIFITADSSVIQMYNCNVKMSMPLSMNTNQEMMKGVLGLCGAIGSVSKNPIGGLSNAIDSIASMKPTYKMSGSLSGGCGLMGLQTPMLIRKYPNRINPKFRNKLEGYPLFNVSKLSNISGFTIVEKINLSGVNCTDSERDEIVNLLKEGVLI